LECTPRPQLTDNCGQYRRNGEHEDARAPIDFRGQRQKLDGQRRQHQKHRVGPGGKPDFLALGFDIFCDLHR
jgi:hypothetical protein